jgi:hypothetical protein
MLKPMMEPRKSKQKMMNSIQETQQNLLSHFQSRLTVKSKLRFRVLREDVATQNRGITSPKPIPPPNLLRAKE